MSDEKKAFGKPIPTSETDISINSMPTGHLKPTSGVSNPQGSVPTGHLKPNPPKQDSGGGDKK